jgi:hypothetical protein
MESESSLPFSQQPTINRYPEPDQSIPTLVSYFFKIYFNIILPSMPTPFKWFLPQFSSPKPCIYFSSIPFVPHALPMAFFFI